MLPNNGKYKWLPILHDLVLIQKPKTIIEIGPGKGDTTITMALALKEIGEGKITSYDIWNDTYWGNHNDCQDNINQWGVGDYVTVSHLDFYDWIKMDPNDRKFDFLYFDINNDGEKILELYNNTKNEIDMGSTIVFEGGSQIRDQVDWMSSKQKINDVKSEVDYSLLTDDIKYSLSIIYNKKLYKLEY